MKLRRLRFKRAQPSNAAYYLLALIMTICCGERAAAQDNAAALAARQLNLATASEVALEIEARAPGASWARAGAEAAALIVSVDGKYNQDLMLWAGDRPYTYRVTLGQLSPGAHQISVSLNPARSARAAQRAEIVALRATAVAPGEGVDADDLLALARSPILYARANTIDRFTDLPLLMYYEVENDAAGDKLIRYTTVFTHEDGGTPAVALMSRWGRMTDIEWTYELRVRGGRVVAETFQGVEHETKSFQGERIWGQHPLLATASDNNNFSDLACSAVRFAPLPVRVRLHSGSREVVMDERPELYRVMTEELQRERRLGETPSGMNVIADPRRYLYLEGYGEQRGATLAFEVGTGQISGIIKSDHGDARLRIERSGYFRSAIFLPAGQSATSVSLRCHARTGAAPGGACQNVKLNKAFLLDDNYRPQPLKFEAAPARTLTPGQEISYRLTN